MLDGIVPLLNEEVAYKKGRARDLRDPKNGASQIIQNASSALLFF